MVAGRVLRYGVGGDGGVDCADYCGCGCVGDVDGLRQRLQLGRLLLWMRRRMLSSVRNW